MARSILWVVAALMAAMALVAGCINVDVPKGPYVAVNDGARTATPRDRAAVSRMDKQTLEDEVLRLTAENDRLRQEVAKVKREKKTLDDEKNRLEDRVENLQDENKKLRKR